MPLNLGALSELPLVFFDTMSDGVMVSDQLGNIIECNLAFHRNLGYEKAELLGRSVKALDTPEFAAQVDMRLKQIADEGRITFETAHCRKDGSIMPVEISAHRCTIGGETAFFGIVRDISSRKQHESELRQREMQLAQAEAIAHIGSWELDLTTNHLRWSDEIFRIFEIDPERFEPSYEGFVKAIHPEDREAVDRAYRESVKSGKPYEITHRLLLSGNRIKWVSERGLTFYEQDEPVRSVGTVQDITQRKLAEDALRQSEAHLHSLIETLPDLVWLKDPDGRYLACNHRFETFFGATEAQILGKTDYDFVDRELADFFRIHDKKALDIGGPSRNEEAITFASDGHRELLEVIKTPVFDSDGGLVGVLGVGRDITERKRFENELREGFEVYQAAINTSMLGFWAVDSQGRLVDVNEVYIHQSGYSHEELLKMTIPDLEAQESPEETKAHIQEIINNGFARFRSRHRRKDGSIWPVEVVTSYSPIQGGRFFAFIEDLTEKVEQEQRLELAATVFNTMNQAVVVTDASNRIVSINQATTEVTGYSFEELQGRNPNIFSSGRHDRAFFKQMWDTLNVTGHWESEIWDRRKDGSVYPKWLTINAIYDQQGNVTKYVSVFSDISERKKTEEVIWRQANFDALTGLANRTLFQNTLQQVLDRQCRSGGNLAIVYLDLDGFKDVNDSLGHAAGDRLLIEVAERLKHRIRKTDLVARMGGDEFTLLLADIRQPEQVGTLAEDILKMLARPFQIMGREIHVGASLGIAFCPEDGETPGELIKHADLAMYQAKARGKNNFQYFRAEMNAMAIHRLNIIHELHQAYEGRALQVYYQPKMRLSDQKIIGMEALVRWPLADGKMRPPSEFIPYAEETGLIVNIGGWVLDEACRQVKKWNHQFDTQLKVSVNLAPRQFRNQNLVGEVSEVITRHGISGGMLELEITESSLMDDVDEAIRIMDEIRTLDIAIAIDDFGTGYSSLNYLKRFPINTLKIDKSFLQEVNEETQDAAIVSTIISLARNLGLEVVAEGVEREEQLLFLRANRCDSCQGYYLAKPMSAEAFEKYLVTMREDLI